MPLTSRELKIINKFLSHAADEMSLIRIGTVMDFLNDFKEEEETVKVDDKSDSR